MQIRVDQRDDNFYFCVESGDNVIFDSSDPDLPFLGEYGEYKTAELAEEAASLFAFSNFTHLVKMADLEDSLDSDSIRNRVVAKFSRGVDIFLHMLDLVSETKKKGDLKTRIQNLKQMMDQYTKAILDTAKTFENDERIDDVPEDIPINEIGFSELKSDSAKQLIGLKKKVRVFYRRLKEDFGQYLEPVAANSMKRILVAGEIDWYKDILVSWGSDVAKSIGSGARLSSIEKNCCGFDVTLATDDGSLKLSFSNDLTLEGIHPQEGLIDKYPHMSQRYYNDLWLPVFMSVGNFRINENVVAVPVSYSKDMKIGYQDDGRYLKNRFKAYDLREDRDSVVDVYLMGDEVCKSCSFVVASKMTNREDRIKKSLDEDLKILSRTKMVIIENTGTKYDGMAGEIDHKGIIRHSDHLEVPVFIEYDNGKRERVVVTSDHISRYA